MCSKALVLAHERSREFGDLRDSVRGCVFFGVPHRGAKIASWASSLAKLTEMLGFEVNPNFTKALWKKSKIFADISKQFVERAGNIKFRTFYETERLHGYLVRSDY
jgi:hypothetical protein